MHASLRHDHVFFDAEGTLWIPRPGRHVDDFWADPTIDNAAAVFEPAPQVHETLGRLRALGARLVVVSKHRDGLLQQLLAHFRLAPYFDDVLLNQDKGEQVARWLRTRDVARHRAVMIGDRHDLDIAPLERQQIRALLLDRPENAGSPAERIADLGALMPLLLTPVAPAAAAARPAATPHGPGARSAGTPASSPS